jgi:tetratricopeptide (TPR) repeat protein
VTAAVLFAGWYVLLRRPAAGLATRAWVIASAFENKTGDSVFDGTLQAALTTGLEQSALVNVFPRSRIQQTLTRMGRPTDSKLDESLAREVAQREGIGAIVGGEIHRVDSTFMITARVVDPTSGAALTAVSRSAKGRTGVIEALDEVVRQLRKELGESRALLAKHDLPLPLATTRSLEGLRKFVQAKDAWNNGDRNQAMNLWQEATALDSDFALAHASLGGAYYWANDRPQGEEHFARALKLLDRLTDRERFLVRSQVEGWRGNREAAIDILKARLAAYPDDREVWAAIGYNYMRLNRDHDALDAYAKQLAIDSGSVTDLINIATAHKGLKQYEESLRYYEKAFALQPSFRTLDNLNHEYGTTLVMAGKSKEARATFTLMLSGTPENQAMGHRSLGMLDELEGRFDDAIGHFRQAAVLSQARQRPLSEARNRVFLAMALREKGRADSARVELGTAYTLFRKNYFEPTFIWYLGKALVANGQVAHAKELLDSLTRRASNPEDRRSQLSLQGEIALAEGRVTAAMSALQSAYATDSNLMVQETLARGLAASGDLAGAAREYESLLTNRSSWFGWEAQIYAQLAGHELGSVLERMGDVPRARQAYERLLSQWSARPDTGLVAVRDARARLAATVGTIR